VIWTRRWNTIEELAEATKAFIRLYNHEWLIERHSHRIPREAYLATTETAAA
jgi:hypothetical protein